MLGWLPDYPDFRAYTEGHEEVNKVIALSGILKKAGVIAKL